MVFSSITFLFVFLPGVLVFYCLLPKKARNVFLLAASLLFYYWGEPSFLLVMAASIVWNYAGGLLCGCIKKEALRKAAMIIAVAGNLGLLFWFKYLDFGIDTVNRIFGTELALRNTVLPIGISFFTFQGLSYVIDVYRKNTAPQKNPIYIALYISMFPQLIAGPIVRYTDIESELASRSIGIDKMYRGIERFAVGLFKKAVIANTLALPADRIFALSPEQLSCPTAWLGAILYTFQIFFDFSGYSDMAIGLGHMLGFTFPENFNYPYISKSVREFWRRWHITLSSWFRDYLYIPMGGSRKGNVYLHLIIVFLLTGLWHGASVNFVVWGLWHGLFMLLERVYTARHTEKQSEKPLAKTGRHVYTMAVVVIGWVLFRSDNLSYACRYLKTMFAGSAHGTPLYGTAYYLDAFSVLILLLALVISARVFPRLSRRIGAGGEKLRCAYTVCKNIGIVVLLLISVISVMTCAYNPFIYFRF